MQAIVLDRSTGGLPEYVDSPRIEAKPGRSRLAVGFIACAAFAVGAVWFARSSNESESATTSAAVAPTAVSPQVVPTPSEIAAADTALQEHMANGWVPFGGAPSLDGSSVPSPAWVKWDQHPDPGDVTADGRVAVYDQPNGNVVGYSYSGLGYVSKATVDAGTFDPAQARIAKFGCDPHTDDACREQLSKQVVARG